MTDQAASIEAAASKLVDSSGKLAATDMIGKSQEEIAALKQQEINKILMGNSPMGQRYRNLNKQLGIDYSEFGDASSSVLNYDPKTKRLIQ